MNHTYYITFTERYLVFSGLLMIHYVFPLNLFHFTNAWLLENGGWNPSLQSFWDARPQVPVAKAVAKASIWMVAFPSGSLPPRSRTKLANSGFYEKKIHPEAVSFFRRWLLKSAKFLQRTKQQLSGKMSKNPKQSLCGGLGLSTSQPTASKKFSLWRHRKRLAKKIIENAIRNLSVRIYQLIQASKISLSEPDKQWRTNCPQYIIHCADMKVVLSCNFPKNIQKRGLFLIPKQLPTSSLGNSTIFLASKSLSIRLEDFLWKPRMVAYYDGSTGTMMISCFSNTYRSRIMVVFEIWKVTTIGRTHFFTEPSLWYEKYFEMNSVGSPCHPPPLASPLITHQTRYGF